MAINVAGTNALGDFLASQIQNTRVLFGEAPAATTVPAVGAATSQLPTHAQLAQQLSDAQLANTQILFGLPQSSSDSSAAGSLPPIAGQTAQQIRSAGIQESVIAQQFQNTSTLFNSLGIGANVNTFA